MKYYHFKVDLEIERKSMEARDVVFAQPSGDVVTTGSMCAEFQ